MTPNCSEVRVLARDFDASEVPPSCEAAQDMCVLALELLGCPGMTHLGVYVGAPQGLTLQPTQSQSVV